MKYLKFKKFYKSRENYILMYRIIELFFNINSSELETYDFSNIYYLYYVIEFFVKETIHDKFFELSAPEETKESIFDEFVENDDSEKENLDIDIFDKYEEIANYYIKYSIVNLNMSHKECMDSIFTDLLDFIKFDKKINPQQKQENEDDVY